MQGGAPGAWSASPGRRSTRGRGVLCLCRLSIAGAQPAPPLAASTPILAPGECQEADRHALASPWPCQASGVEGKAQPQSPGPAGSLLLQGPWRRLGGSQRRRWAGDWTRGCWCCCWQARQGPALLLPTTGTSGAAGGPLTTAQTTGASTTVGQGAERLCLLALGRACMPAAGRRRPPACQRARAATASSNSAAAAAAPGNCGFDYIFPDAPPSGWEVVALSDQFPSFSGSCGACYEVSLLSFLLAPP